jgi:hypothetical protein
MSKAITATSCAYVHTDDVDPEKHINAGPINAAMEATVKWAIAALENPAGAYTDFHRANIQTVFSSMLSTHGLIRRVLAAGWENPESIDALALARVPLEGLYTLCIMFEDPSWVDAYLKDGWKKQYVRLLLEAEETKNLPRFDEFCKKFAPHNLDELRQFHKITDAQVATINNEQLGTSMPQGMVKEEIPHFPTPSPVINKLTRGSDKRRMLERLYPEYVFLCSFAHGLPDALLFKMMFNKNARVSKQFDDEELKDTFHRQVEQPAYILSLISLVQGAAELTTLYPGNVDLMAAVVKAWQEISEGSLLGKAIWNIRTKSLLGIVG